MEIGEFRNTALTDFADPANVAKMEAALAKVGAALGKTYPLIIGGREIHEGRVLDSVNPGEPKQVVGRFVQATAELANEAVETAAKAFESWKNVSARERAEVILKTAALLREKKFEFSALMVYEVSKSWAEADGDIAELIDFLEYYA